MTPVPALTSCDVTSGVITVFQHWHHLYSSSVGEKDLSNDTQIRVISSVELEISAKMLRNLCGKLTARLPVTTRGYSMVKCACLNGALCSFSFWTGSKPSSEKGKAQKMKKYEKPKDVGHFLKILISAHAQVKIS